MAYLRPERFVTLARRHAAEARVGVRGGGARERRAPHGARRRAVRAGHEDGKKLASALQRQVPGPLLEQVGELSSKLDGPARQRADLDAGARRRTSRRTASASSSRTTSRPRRRAIATEGASLSSLSVKERLRDLLAYAVSEPYFQVRRHLGLHVRGEVTA